MRRHTVIITFALLMLPFLQVQYGWGQPNKKETAKLFQQDEKQNSTPDFSSIDHYVLNLKTKKKLSNDELVAQIIQQSQTKIEKARAIFIWIANNIAYDTSRKITTKEEALKQGKGVCEAYSGLYKEFCELAGLEVVIIQGDSKQYYYKKPSDLDKGGHAWNAVKSDDGRWVIVDATWGAGHVNNGTFTRNLSTYWFDPAPEICIFTHFPKEEKWQLLSKPVSRDKFLRMPPLSPNLALWGFNPEAIFSYYTKAKDASFPDTYSVDVDWKINTMPVCGVLKTGKPYEFEFNLPENEEVAIIYNDKDWVKFQKDGNKFGVTFTPEKKGHAIVAVKQPNGKFGGVFRYEIKEWLVVE